MRRTTPALTTAAVVCGLLLISPLQAQAAELGPVATIGELRAAVTAANGTPEADTITLDGALTYTLDAGAASEDDNATGDLDVDVDLVIEGNGATLDAAGVDRFFDVFGGTLTLNDVTIVDGDVPDTENGGAVRVATGAALVVTGGAMNNNTATNAGAPAATAGSGGAIATAGALTVTGTSFDSNTASRAGGAIEVSVGGSATVTGATFTGNGAGSAPGNGGALHLTGATTADVVDSGFTGNTAAEGGALWNSAAGTLTVSGSDILGNTANGAAADQGGGGVFSEGGLVEITGALIQGNDATGTLGSGGGILNLNGTVSVQDSAVVENTAVRAGGGIEAGPLLGVPALPTVTGLTGVELSDNVVTGPPGNGGGLHLTGEGVVAVDESTVSGNTAVEGGGLWNSETGAMLVTNSTLSGNTASGADGGGALYQDGTATSGVDAGIVAFNVTITGNALTGAGAGAASFNAGLGGVALIHASVTGNDSGVAGQTVLGNTVLTANTGDDADAAVLSAGGNVLDEALPIAPDAGPAATDVTGVTDPRLGALADNGGLTQTLLPATGSPVIDAGITFSTDDMDAMGGPSLLLDADQRGVVRPLDGNGDGSARVDAGSVEAPAVAVTPAPTGGVTPPAKPVVAQPDYTG